jgi:hypothetical protein
MGVKIDPGNDRTAMAITADEMMQSSVSFHFYSFP